MASKLPGGYQGLVSRKGLLPPVCFCEVPFDVTTCAGESLLMRQPPAYHSGTEGLHHIDVFILFWSVAKVADGAKGSQGSAMVSVLHNKGMLLVIIQRCDQNSMRDMALAVTDRVAVTKSRTVEGLEQRWMVVCVHREVQRCSVQFQGH
ncbi:uncharacterized protein LOC143298672 [Babylonia areolata]|uniref:uncharacterized protein LOC143298672 n=1 Tax=Babylonia areolata TaxID=304850 RepID=UPI003FD579BC